MPYSSSLILDTFKERGPVLFDGANRIPAVEDVRNVLIYVCFTTLFVAFLLIFPGIRKERVSTFICVTVSLLIGAVILVSNFGTNWHVAQASISSPYRAFSKEKIFAKVVVRVGLQSVNISLQALALHSRSEEINFNERFYWIDPLEMKLEHRKALAKGLPFPILTVAEYLSQDEEGFCWGRRYRLAGYFASISLWAAFCCWLLMNVFLCAVPRYGVYCMQATGILMLVTDAIYVLLLPRKPLVIPFENEILTFTFGWCFWVVLVGGILAVAIGAVVLIVDILFPNKISTILEIDYDTPYRYFVGNDAHLFGHTTCPHAAASPTSSSATASTCCGNMQDSRKSRQLRKMKSDASTSTTMSIPIKKNNLDLSERVISSSTSPIITTTAKIEDNLLSATAFSNDAFEGDVDSRVTVVNSSEEIDSEDSDVSTTIIDGKRAISLHNFGKFTAQQQLKRDSKQQQDKSSSSQAQRRIHSGSAVTQQQQENLSPGQSSSQVAAASPSAPIPLTTSATTTTSPTRRSLNNSHHVHVDLTTNPAALW